MADVLTRRPLGVVHLKDGAPATCRVSVEEGEPLLFARDFQRAVVSFDGGARRWRSPLHLAGQTPPLFEPANRDSYAHPDVVPQFEHL